MPSNPTVLVSLQPDGTLALALPGAHGERLVPVRPGKIEATLQRVLFSLALGEANLGEDGAPTVAQARCWSQHSAFPDARCPFCRASGRFDYKNERKATTRVVSEVQRGEVTVRRIRPGMTAAREASRPKSLIAAQNAEEII